MTRRKGAQLHAGCFLCWMLNFFFRLCSSQKEFSLAQMGKLNCLFPLKKIRFLPTLQCFIQIGQELSLDKRKVSVWCLFSHYCWFLWHKHSSNIGLCFDTFKSPPICWELPMKSSGPDARVEEAGQYHNCTCLLKVIEHAYDHCSFVIQPLWGPQFFAFCLFSLFFTDCQFLSHFHACLPIWLF